MDNVPELLECSLCKNQQGQTTTFTKKTDYKQHLGTKKHKRNARSARGAVFDEEAAHLPPPPPPPLELADVTGLNDYKGERESYSRKKPKYLVEHYVSYVNSIVAYWAVTLSLNPTVQDFKISVNDKKWQCFGDAVVEVQFNELPEKPSSSTLHVIQFADVASNVKSLDSFKEGTFNFEDIAKGIAKTKQRITQRFERLKFIVYTTAAPNSSLDDAELEVTYSPGFYTHTTCKCTQSSDAPDFVYARKMSNQRNVVLNTSEDNESVFRFFSKISKQCLPKIYIYSYQKKLRQFPDAIEESICDSFGEKRMHIARELVKYVDNWQNGKCGGFYKLKKQDMLTKLGRLLLAPLRVNPTSRDLEHNEYTESRFALWVQAIKSADITVLEPSSELSNLIQPFILPIEQQLALQINTTNNRATILRNNAQDDREIENPILKFFLSKETNVPLEKLYLAFWEAGLMPLILQVKNEGDRDYIFQVVSVLKSYGFTRRYLVKTTDTTVQTSGYKTLRPVSVFVHLADISDKLGPNLLDNIQIGVTHQISLSLAEIDEYDKVFKKKICPGELFDMILEKYFFEPSYSPIKQGGDEDYKLILSTNLMERLKEGIEASNERNTNDALPNNWLRGVNPEMFL